MEHRGVHGRVDLAVEQCVDQLLLQLGIVVRVGEQEHVAVLVGDVLGTLDHRPGVWRGDDLVADERDRVGDPAPQALGHRVGPVAELLGRPPHPRLGLGADRVGLAVEHERRRGRRHLCRLGDVTQTCHRQRITPKSIH